MKEILTYLFEGQTDLTEQQAENYKFNPLFNVQHIYLAQNSRDQKVNWFQIVDCISNAKRLRADKIILCYNNKLLKNSTYLAVLYKVVPSALELNTKILIGSTYSDDATLVPVADHLFWTDSIEGADFLIIYEPCYELILAEDFSSHQTTIACLESLTSNKMLIYPMMTDQISDIRYQKIGNRMERLMLKRIDFKNNRLKLSLND